jgi:predicted GIY-YIG superfamily endonuclease
MPFRDYLARTFKAATIHREAPAASGVYGLSNAHEWIYVGETDDIQARLLEHLEEANAFRTARLPTGFNFETCSPHDRVARQRRLILELEPAWNVRTGRLAVSAHDSTRRYS